jgi:hypothetical protein
MHVPLAQKQLQLAFRKIRIHQRHGDHVK